MTTDSIPPTVPVPESHPEWYHAYIASPRWQARKAQYFATRARRCAACRSRKRVDLHHRTYQHRGHEKVADLVPLCRECHVAVHQLAHAKAWLLDETTDRYIAHMRQHPPERTQPWNRHGKIRKAPKKAHVSWRKTRQRRGTLIPPAPKSLWGRRGGVWRA